MSYKFKCNRCKETIDLSSEIDVDWDDIVTEKFSDDGKYSSILRVIHSKCGTPHLIFIEGKIAMVLEEDV